MKEEAKKYAKLLVFKDSRMNKLVSNIAETRTDKHKYKSDKIDKHYPYNGISKYFPTAHMFPREVHMKYKLPCGFLYGESWGALKKCWRGYRAAKDADDEILMREYATRIQKIQTELGIATASFPNLGLIGDIFFLYDKHKESALRQKYMHEHVVCDKYDVDNVEQLVREGKAEMYDSMLEYKKAQEAEQYKVFQDVFDSWTNSEITQEYVKASTRRWAYRSKIRKEIKTIKEELTTFTKIGSGNALKLSKEEREMRKLHKQELRNKILLKESELESANNVQLVRTDTGWKYCKEIIKNDYRRTKIYDYEPRYYLTDLGGHRLADYKEENDLGYVKDPYFYKLYLEDKEWEKIYSKEQEQEQEPNTNTD